MTALDKTFKTCQGCQNRSLTCRVAVSGGGKAGALPAGPGGPGRLDDKPTHPAVFPQKMAAAEIWKEGMTMLRAHLAEKYANGDARWVFSMPAFLSLGELLKQLPIREKKACFLLEITDPDTLVIELDGLPKGKPIATRCLNRFILARQVVRAEYVVSPTGPTGYFIRIASAKAAAPLSEKPEKRKG